MMHLDICFLRGKVDTILLKTFQDLEYFKWNLLLPSKVVMIPTS